jgi:hypothetical protein
LSYELPNPIRPAFTEPTDEGHVIVNIGPSHPATHGTIQIVAELDGEKVVRQVVVEVAQRAGRARLVQLARQVHGVPPANSASSAAIVAAPGRSKYTPRVIPVAGVMPRTKK